MDLNKEEPPTFLGQSRQVLSVDACVPGGCNLALLIAFNHLKKRFAAQSAELKKLKSKNMNSELHEECSSTLILERKVDQLQRSLQNKITAYNNLEDTYKQTRENEEAMIKHTSETEQFLLEVMGKSITYQKENNELKEQVDMLKSQLSKLESEKHQIEEELLEIKNIPEVSVSKNLPVTCSVDDMSPRGGDSVDVSGSQKHLKQIEALLYENKTLKTNMYWLATELKTVKNKEGLTPPRVRLDSGGLEEGRAGQISSSDDRSEVCRCFKNFVAYTRKLERTISTLRTAIDKNNIIINNLLLKKFGHVPKILRKNDSLGSCKLTESYVTITGEDTCELESSVEIKDHTILWETHEEEDTYNLPELESASVIVPLDELTSDDEAADLPYDISGDLQTQLSIELQHDEKEEVEPEKICRPDREKREEPLNYHLELEDDDDDDAEDGKRDHDSLNESYGEGALKKFNCPCNLPLSLLHNLELQQTKTYLTSKKSNESCNGNHLQDIRTISPKGAPYIQSNNAFETFQRDIPGKMNCVEFT